MTFNLSRIRKAITAALGTATTVYGSLVVLSPVGWWVPIVVAGVAGVGVGAVTWLVPNSQAPATS